MLLTFMGHLLSRFECTWKSETIWHTLDMLLEFICLYYSITKMDIEINGTGFQTRFKYLCKGGFAKISSDLDYILIPCLTHQLSNTYMVICGNIHKHHTCWCQGYIDHRTWNTVANLQCPLTIYDLYEPSITNITRHAFFCYCKFWHTCGVK